MNIRASSISWTLPLSKSHNNPILSGFANSNSFFDEVDRICAPNYMPTEHDVLRARTKTTGIYETRFTMGQLSIQ